jgi:hypothetical protein
MRNEKRNIDQKIDMGDREEAGLSIHRCQYVSTFSTTLLHGDPDTPPQVSQVSFLSGYPSP